MKKKVALIYREWSECSLRMLEGVFSHSEVRQRCEFRDFPVSRGERELVFPAHWRPDGAILALDEGDPRAESVRTTGLPVVTLGTEWAGAALPSSCFDLLSFSGQALNHFAKISCGSLLFVGVEGQSDSVRVAKLLRRKAEFFGIRKVASVFLSGRGWETNHLEQGLGEHPEVRRALESMPRPFGVLTMTDDAAVFLKNACGELGLRVPGEALILSGLDSRRVHFSDPAISAMACDRLEIGRRGMAMLEGLLEGRVLRKHAVRVAVTGVHARASTLGDDPLDQSIERVRQMIRQRACEGITVEEILSHLDMSRPTLEKRYRELTGMSPAQEIRRLRAERARELLLTTSLPVSKVARSVGFDDPRPFMVFFKREFGHTPGAFRQVHR